MTSREGKGRDFDGGVMRRFPVKYATCECVGDGLKSIQTYRECIRFS
jgi:hypothetical protein